MKKTLFFAMLLASVTVFTACTSDDEADTENIANSDPGTIIAASGELSTFEVHIDRTTAEPTSTVKATYPETGDDISQQSFATVVNIDMANPTATTDNGVEITVSDGHVTANHGSTEGICYVVSGTTDNGSLTIKGKTDYELNLNGTDITNPTSTAVNLDSKLAAYIVLTGTNKLTDGTTEDHKSAFYSKGKMLFSGTGTLEVYGNYNNGIHSKSYMVFDKGINVYVKAANHGIKTSNVTDDNDMVTTYGTVTINGGTLSLTSTGAGGKGINADGTFTLNGGTTTIKTSGNALGASSSGTLTVITNSRTLDNYDSDYKSSPKGVKVDGAIVINDGVINVTTSGAGGEGIESKTSITFNGGYTYVSSSDDGINASYNTDTNGSGDMTVNGGYIYCISSGNDAMDSNGNFYIKGGFVYAVGTGNPEKSLDANTEQGKKLYISGGTLVAVGDLEGSAQISNGTCKYTSSWTKNAWYALYNGGTLAAIFKTPSTGSTSGGGGGPWGGGSSSLKLIVYTSGTPTMSSGVTVSGGEAILNGNVNSGGTVSGGSNVTLNNYTSSGGGGRW